ncbi:MAG: hypothetical protein KBT10_00080 [Bacteroidales bacterium]|nr:hypothetical protein [Candidatus Sodaliphilus aphodohippi]
MLKFIKRCIDWALTKYEWLMRLILKGRHVQVNREKYIRKLVDRFYCDSSVTEQKQLVERALNGTLPDILDDEQQQKAYCSLRWRYGTIVFLVSFFMTTVPDNMWVVIASCAIDLYIFQCMQFRAMQKIMMLYGQHIDLNDNITGGIDTILSVDRSGVMVGKYPLLQKMKSGLGFLAKQLVKKQGPKFVTKMARSVFLVIRRQCIKWFSMVVAKEDVAMAFELLIPITCAIISGIVSVVVLIPMCNKLQKKIKSGTLHAALQTNQDTNANIEEESVRRS